jgi:hypothetical protein
MSNIIFVNKTDFPEPDEAVIIALNGTSGTFGYFD